MEQLRIEGKRAVLFANPTPVDGHYYPSFVLENEPFHRPADWDWGTDLRHVEACVKSYNAERGYSEEEADEVVMSSIRAANRLRKRGVRFN